MAATAPTAPRGMRCPYGHPVTADGLYRCVVCEPDEPDGDKKKLQISVVENIYAMAVAHGPQHHARDQALGRAQCEQARVQRAVQHLRRCRLPPGPDLYAKTAGGAAGYTYVLPDGSFAEVAPATGDIITTALAQGQLPDIKDQMFNALDTVAPPPVDCSADFAKAHFQEACCTWLQERTNFVDPSELFVGEAVTGLPR